jgi:hypothetical protein
METKWTPEGHAEEPEVLDPVSDGADGQSPHLEQGKFDSYVRYSETYSNLQVEATLLEISLY